MFIFVCIHMWALHGASLTHDEKSIFLIIFKCFLLFSTMRTHSKYTTHNPIGHWISDFFFQVFWVGHFPEAGHPLPGEERVCVHLCSHFSRKNSRCRVRNWAFTEAHDKVTGCVFFSTLPVTSSLGSKPAVTKKYFYGSATNLLWYVAVS